MPSPLYKYSELRWARALISEGSIKVGTLSEYRSKEGHDQERSDGHEGELTLHSPPGRHEYGGEKLPPLLRNPNIHIGSRALVTEGRSAIQIHSRIPDLFIYCTSEVYDNNIGHAFTNGEPMGCVQINQPERFFLALDAALRDEVKASGITLSEPKWERCVYEDSLHDWERENLPAIWRLKPTKFQLQREVRGCWQPNPMQRLESRVLEVLAIIPYCTLIYADPEMDKGDVSQ